MGVSRQTATQIPIAIPERPNGLALYSFYLTQKNNGPNIFKSDGIVYAL